MIVIVRGHVSRLSQSWVKDVGQSTLEAWPWPKNEWVVEGPTLSARDTKCQYTFEDPN